MVKRTEDSEMFLPALAGQSVTLPPEGFMMAQNATIEGSSGLAGLAKKWL